MLTIEMLSGIEGLSKEHAERIAEMSKNDEDAIITKRSSDIWSALDDAIFETAGVKREAGEKTSEYAKRVIGSVKSKADAHDDVLAKYTSAQAEARTLKKQLEENGGDAGVAEKYEQAKRDLKKVKDDYETKAKEFEQFKSKTEAELYQTVIKTELHGALNGIKFAPTVTEGVKNMAINTVMDKLLSLNPTYVEAEGRRHLQFKSAEGVTLMNPDRNLNPYTPAELFEKEFKALGILETGRKQEGGGTGPDGTPTGGVDFMGAKTRAEAHTIIDKHIMQSKGLLKGTPAFDEAKDQILNDHPEVRELPEREE